MTIQKLLEIGKKAFIEHGKGDQLLDVRLLIEYILDCDYTYILLNMDKEISKVAEDRFHEHIEERLRGRPLQQITNQWSFMGLEFYVNEFTLIPRSDTECLVELVNSLAEKIEIKKVLDIGTGTGCIPISICKFNEEIEAEAIDISSEALKVAKQNGENHQLENRITWKRSDLFEELDDVYYNKYDIITSNPPYIRSGDIQELMIEVREFEPLMALDGGNDGLDFYREISENAGKYLKDYGYLIFEIGHDQYEDVYKILEGNSFKSISYCLDAQGIKRVIYGIKNRGEKNV